MDAAACTITSSNTMQPKRCMIQNYLLIWIDENINEANKDCQNTLTQLRSVVNEVTICTEPAQCIKCLNDMNDEKAFVISSGALGQHLIPQIHDMPQLYAIYVFCGNESQHKVWIQEWSKIQGVFTSIKPICDSLKKVARDCDHDAISMSFVPKRMMAATSSDQQNLDQLEPSYMYSVLFKEIVLEIKEPEAKSLNDLVIYCRSKGISGTELKNFQSKYHQESPIWWYTCEIFLYGMLNRALRSLDMETMTKMGFFIRNLHRQLEQLHKEQSSAFTKKFVVYRGQGLSEQDFQHLVDTKGGLLSFDSFLSTSTKQQVAMDFVQRAMHKNKDTMGVLFVMTIDPSKVSASSTLFALVTEYSAVKNENEILFSMHSVFRVGDIKKTANNSRLWKVQLTLTDENDPQLATLTQRMQEALYGSTAWERLGDLLIQVGHFNQADELYNELLKDASNDSAMADIYHQLGRVKSQQGRYEKGITFYKKSLEIKRKIFPEDHPSLALTYNNIGLAYNNMNDYLKALNSYEKANKIYEKSVPPNHPDLATSYNNIGTVYYNMCHYSKALEFYDNALKIREKVLPSNHPSLATSYNNIGLMYKNMGGYSKALEFYEKAHQIKEKALPPSHPSLAISYANIGMAYSGIGAYSKALSFLEKALAILQKSVPLTHPHMKTTIDYIDYVKKKL
ncbi:unnamed protein product [Rotaria sp. Silwood1]|nr:unnamed protein product [Rotaria sp. Silwood1]